MMAKIEWYEEALILDPGSRLFFPFAHCLVEQGMNDRAIEVLRAGLVMHPEDMEARILLVHLLDERGDSEASCAESRRIADVMMAYPGFWKSLGEAVAQARGSDVALCLRFVSAALRDPSVTLTGMVARGLELIQKTEGAQGTEKASSPEQVVCLADGDRQQPDLELQQPPAEKTDADTTEAPGQGTQQSVAAVENVAGPEDGDLPAQILSERVETEEPVSLKTRSMAQILAEQGDLDGALTIYEELAAQDPDSADLRRKIGELKRQKTDGGERSRGGSLDSATAGVNTAVSLTPPKEADVCAPAVDQGGEAVMALLEGLADRLEARAEA